MSLCIATKKTKENLAYRFIKLFSYKNINSINKVIILTYSTKLGLSDNENCA